MKAWNKSIQNPAQTVYLMAESFEMQRPHSFMRAGPHLGFIPTAAGSRLAAWPPLQP